MKMKKLLSFMLCLVMLMTTALTSCQKEKTEEELAEEANVELVMLNMYIVTDDSTTEEQMQSIEIAINEVTIKDTTLKSKVNVNFIKADEFREVLDADMEYLEEYDLKYANTTRKKSDSSMSLDQIYTQMRKSGINLDRALPKTQFSSSVLAGVFGAYDMDTVVPQIDVIVFDKYETYYDYVYPGVDEYGVEIPSKLHPLDEFLKTENKILTSYIYPSYLEAAKLGGTSIYGIPVNGPIGEYEYIVIDRELALKHIADEGMLTKEDFETEEEYNEYFDNYVIENYNTFPKLAPFLAAVSAAEAENGIVPLEKATTPGNVEFLLGEGSPVGVVFEGYEWPTQLMSVYHDESVREHFKSIYDYRQAGYMADENTPKDAKFAVRVMNGSSTTEQLLEEADEKEYIFITYKYPKFVNEEVLSGVFAVSAKSYNKDRAMKLIEMFNTDPELANILQWGVENGSSTYIPEGMDKPVEGNYILETTDGAKTIVLYKDGNGYKMNNNHTGNKYLKYRLSGELDEFEGQKIQNTESWIGAFSGFKKEYALVVDNNKAAADQLSEKRAAYLQLKTDLTMPYFNEFINGTGDRPFDERYDELLKMLNRVEESAMVLGDTGNMVEDNELVDSMMCPTFNSLLESKYTSQYTVHLTKMSAAYPYGRKASLLPPEEETEETEETEEGELAEDEAELTEEETEKEDATTSDESANANDEAAENTESEEVAPENDAETEADTSEPATEDMVENADDVPVDNTPAENEGSDAEVEVASTNDEANA